MDIEFTKTSHLEKFKNALHNKAEDMIFAIILKIPERLIPRSFMEWLDKYLTRRTNQLNQKLIKDKWRIMNLEKVLDEISRENQADK